MSRCEDWPCCGHTDGLGCDYQPDMDYIYAHALCDHEVGDCALADYYDEPDPDTCEHGDAYLKRGRWECDLCGTPLVMVTDQSPHAYPSKVVPGLWVEITALGTHFEVAS